MGALIQGCKFCRLILALFMFYGTDSMVSSHKKFESKKCAMSDKILRVGAKGAKGKKCVKCKGKISKNSKQKVAIGTVNNLQENQLTILH